MVRRDLRHRFLAAEIGDPKGIEIRIDRGHGTVRGPHGEQVMREDAVARQPAAGTCLSIISETDARL